MWRTFGLLGLIAGVASADQFGDFTYVDNGANITITDYPEAATGVVEIPADIGGKPVTGIGPEAFALCSEITGVTIPSSVTSIGAQAFLNCTELAGIGDISSVTSIGDGAFASCINLASVTVPSAVGAIGNSVFSSCSGLTSVSIPEGITSIGSSAFTGCSQLTSLVIPSTVSVIGASAFSFCSGLTSMVIPEGVNAIQFALFSDCTNLSSVTIPSSVSTIGQSAFAKCSNLSSISIPSTVTSIGAYAFLECGMLASVEIPSGVTSIGTSTFELCTSLVSVTIPTSVYSFGDNAFKSCGSLQTISIPAAGFTVIGTNVFDRCSALTSITVNAANTSYKSVDGVLFSFSGATLLVYPRGRVGPYAIPSGVTFIGAESFRFAVGVTNIEIPTTVTGYAVEAFAGCSALTSFTVLPGGTYLSGTGSLYSASGKSLLAYPGGLGGDVVIPSTVTTVSTSAFRYNDTLTSVTFPDTIVTIRDTAFANCGQLTAAYFEGVSPVTLFGVNVFLAADPTFTVYFSTTATTGFTVPTWNGYPSSAYGPNASIVNWLMLNNLPPDSDMTSDANHDGVSLLMAYALGLDPSENLSGSLPQPVFGASQMSLSFYAGAAGVTYAVETCTNLDDWTTSGVSLSTPDVNGIVTAFVDMTGSSRYMRLKVSD